jgi:hypothetical protein
MMIEGSGSRSIPLTSGSGSGRPKNMWIRWIRIRISNTEVLNKFEKKFIFYKIFYLCDNFYFQWTQNVRVGDAARTVRRPSESGSVVHIDGSPTPGSGTLKIIYKSGTLEKNYINFSTVCINF